MLRVLRVALILSLLVGARAGAQQMDRFALVIGIAGYPSFDEGRKLKYAGDDAIDFARFLQTPEGGAFPAANVKLLVNSGATRTAIIDSIASLRSSLTPGSLLYVFFSGHTSIDAGGFAHLMPYDGNPARPQDKGWRITAFQKELSSIGARFFILFLDACHAGAATTGDQAVVEDEAKGGNEVSTKLNVEWNRAFERVRSQDGVIFSSSSSQDSFEDDERRHGIFAYYLLRALRGAADSVGVGNRDGTVTVFELMRFLGDSVPNRAMQLRKKLQVPSVTQSLSSTFPLAKYVVNAAPNALLATATTARAHFDAGYRLTDQGQYAAAAAEYRAALAIDPNYSFARNNLGVALDRMGDSAAAFTQFSEAVRRDPSNATARRNLGLYLGIRGDTAEAMRQLRESIRVDATQADAHIDLGTLFQVRQQYDSARAHFSRAYRIDSTKAVAWVRYGAVEAAAGHNDIGILFESYGLGVAKRNPSANTPTRRSWIAEQLATLYESAHERGRAIRVLRDAAADDTAGAARMQARATRLQDQLRSLEKSADSLTQYLKTDPTNETAGRRVHTILHEELLQSDDALAAAESWLSRNPQQTWALANRAENYFTARRYADADRAISALLLNPMLSVSDRAALLAVSAANDLASGTPSGVSAKLSQLESLITAQPDTFRIQWLFYGTRAAIRSVPAFRSNQRTALLTFIAALESRSRSEILAGVRRARTSLQER